MGEVGGAHLEEEVDDLSHQLTNLRDSLVTLTSKTEVRKKADKKAGKVIEDAQNAMQKLKKVRKLDDRLREKRK